MYIVCDIQLYCQIHNAVIDTVVTLEEVNVLARLRSGQVGSKVTSMSRRELLESPLTDLGSLLVNNLNVFVRNYGPGSLATISVRGGSASHTLLLWNGLPISSPMLGLLDFSLSNVHDFESVSMTKGGSSTIWGSGAVSGLIAVNNAKPEIHAPMWHTSLAAGSFGRYQGNLMVQLGGSKLSSVTKLSGLTSVNDFTYRDPRTKHKVGLQHADYDHQTAMQHLYWQPGENHDVAVHYWFRNSRRNLPPTLTQTNSAANQRDQSHRVALEWQHGRSRSHWSVNVGYFNEDQLYLDPALGIEAKNQFHTILMDLTTAQQWSNLMSSTFGTTFSQTEAHSENYGQRQSEGRVAIFSSVNLQHAKIQAQLSVRQAVIDGNMAPFIPRLGVNWPIGINVILKGSLSRNFRLPTLNDRFWQPGGNTLLKPEKGWSQEIGLHIKRASDNPSVTFSSTAYHRLIQDWILWKPASGQAYWSPENIAKVRSRGLENQFSYHLDRAKTQWQLRLNHQINLATNEVNLQQPRVERGTQLTYVPKHQLSAQIMLRTNRFFVNYLHRYVGATNGINADIAAYDLGDLTFNYDFRSRRKLSMQLYLNNIWDRNYIVVERRPMPGFNWQIRFLFSAARPEPAKT